MKRFLPRLPHLTRFQAGLVTLTVAFVIIVVGVFKLNPVGFLSHPYQLTAVFRTANDIQPGTSPVRTAGVNIGTVDKVEPLPDGSGAARVTMTIQPQGLPIHTDATLKVRPRTFLEGNYFMDLSPGSPTAPDLPSGGTIPMTQTAAPVQLGQILDALNSDTRSDLQTFLQQYGTQGLGGDRPGGGAQAYAAAVPWMGPAYRDTSLANEGLLGTQPNDLANAIRGQQRTFGALSADDQALQDLITNFNVAMIGFSRDPNALSNTIPALDATLRVGKPALDSLNSSLPSLRGFAVDALPGVRSTGPMIDAMLPFIDQARQLVSEPELKGLVADLRPTIPALAQFNQSQIPLLSEGRALSSCQNNVEVPFSTAPIPDPDFPKNSDQPFYKQAPRGLVGLAGESRISDADSPQFRILLGGGPTTEEFTGENNQQFFAQTSNPTNTVRPTKPAQQPPFRPDVPCETQKPPDLNAPSGSSGAQILPTAQAPTNPQALAQLGQFSKQLTDFLNAQAKGIALPDPLAPALAKPPPLPPPPQITPPRLPGPALPPPPAPGAPLPAPNAPPISPPLLPQVKP